MAEDTAEQKQQENKMPSFRQSLRIVFNGVSRKDLKGIFWDTVKDLRKPREIGLLLASSFVPGGWIGWFAYRVAKYQFKKAAADGAHGAHSFLTFSAERAPPKYAVLPLKTDDKEPPPALPPAAAPAP